MPTAQDLRNSQDSETPESIGEWTLKDAKWQLQEDRRGLSSRERQQLEPEFDQLGRLFGHLNRRWRRVVGDTRLNHPIMYSLNEMGAEALEISKLIYTELDSFPSERRQTASPALLAKLLRFNEQRLNRLEIQLALLTSMEGYADGFFEILDELFHSEQMSPVGLMNLVDQIINDVREDREAVPSVEPLLMVSIPGLSLQDYLPNRNRKSDSWACAVGLQAARLTAFLVDGDSRFHDSMELLTMAALLQDVGFLCLEQEHRSSPQSLLVKKSKIFHRHASIGAGMVATLKTFPVELPYLVATHHDQLDRSKSIFFPGNSDSRHLAGMMAVISRYVELTTANLKHSETKGAAATADSQIHSAALQIRRDTARGKFESEHVNLLLHGLEIQPRQGSSKNSPDADPKNFTHFTKKKLRHDDSGSNRITKKNEGNPEENSNEVPQPRFQDNNWRREVSRFSEY